MKKLAIVCALALLAGPVFAACSNKEKAEAPLPPEEVAAPLLPEEQSSAEEPEETEETVAPSIPAPAKKEYLKITTNNLNVRAGAGTSYASLGKVESNILMEYAGKSGDFFETSYMGRTAYIHSAYAKIVSLQAADEAVERVIEEGLKRLGTPYVYGATRFHDGKGNLLKGFTDKKFDCSSLMQYIFYRGAGVLLNTTTRTQIVQGKAVTELKRGDLMFFTNATRKNNTGIERVGHVALYLGDNYILHTASDYAKIEQISQTRWSYFLEARRVL